VGDVEAASTVGDRIYGLHATKLVGRCTSQWERRESFQKVSSSQHEFPLYAPHQGELTDRYLGKGSGISAKK
jgi:hypothetical protein